MSRTVKVIGIAAALGFLVPILLLTFSWITGYEYIDRPLFALCPQSIVSMGLDHASTSAAVAVWFLICLSNAFLYATPVAIVLLFLSLFRPAPRPPSILK